MAKGKKTGGRDFVKGKPGGPGRKPLPGDIKAARFLNQIELERMLNHFMYEVPAEQLPIIARDPSRKAIEQMIASIIVQATRNGDQIRLDFLLNRLIGKVKEKIEHSGTLSLEEIVAGSQEAKE